jgi:hypothetical protein
MPYPMVSTKLGSIIRSSTTNPASFLGLLSVGFCSLIFIYLLGTQVLHPYYKLAYIKLSWGGPAEQEAEIAKGNFDAKDWHDEAKQIVEKTVIIF